MKRAIIAIVGRPNVGKSTLFNRIIGRNVAVVEDVPGLTRDRIYGEAVWSGKSFLVVDTGGFQPSPVEGTELPGREMLEEVRQQAMVAIEEADAVVMLMDAEGGCMPSDIELSGILRRYDKKVVYAVNKIDGPSKEKGIYDFYSLGVEPLPLSAKTGYGLDALMERVVSLVPPALKGQAAEYPKIAIVGRPNVGKSTFVNSLLGKNRMIVSPVPGTTRDSVDSLCTYYGRKYLIVDTAGIRRKGKMAATFERYSFIRTLRHIQSCDVALMLVDAVEGAVEMDQKIAGLIYESGKGCILLVNKWDLADRSSLSAGELKRRLSARLWFMDYAPILTVSALTRQRVTRVFPLIDEIVAGSSRRIGTHELNTFLGDTLSLRQPPLYHGKKVKLFYIAQTGISPPCFTAFTNTREGIREPYTRFLERQLRERFSFKGVPVRITVRQRKRNL